MRQYPRHEESCWPRSVRALVLVRCLGWRSDSWTERGGDSTGILGRSGGHPPPISAIQNQIVKLQILRLGPSCGARRWFVVSEIYDAIRRFSLRPNHVGVSKKRAMSSTCPTLYAFAIHLVSLHSGSRNRWASRGPFFGVQRSERDVYYRG